MLLRLCLAIVGLLLTAACAFGPSPSSPVLGIGTFNIRYDNPGDGDNAWSRRRAMVARSRDI